MYELRSVCKSCFTTGCGDFVVSRDTFEWTARLVDGASKQRLGWRNGICPDCLKRGEDYANGKP